MQALEQIIQIASDETAVVIPFNQTNYFYAAKHCRKNELPPLIGQVIYDNTIRFTNNSDSIDVKVAQQEGILTPGNKVVVFNYK